MAATREVYVTELQVDAKQGEAAIRQYETALGKAASAAERAARASDVAGNSIGQQSAAVRMVERSYQSTQKSVDRVVNRYDAAARAATQLRQAEDLLARAQAKGVRGVDDLARVVETLRQRHDAAAGAVNDNAREIERWTGAAGRASAGGGMFEDAISRLPGPLQSIARALGPVGLAFTALGAAAAAAVAPIIAAGDAYTRTIGRLNAATRDMGAAKGVYEDLYRVSLQTGQAVEDSVGQFVRFGIAARQIGATNAEVVQLVETVQRFGIVSGATTQEASAGAIQLGQALASGRLQGDELRSILENMPLLAEALANELGVSIGRLREMGTAGELTAERVFGALLNTAEEAREAFDRMPLTVERASGQMAVAWQRFAAEIDKSLGLSERLAGTLNAIATKLNEVTQGMSEAPAAVASRLRDQRSALANELAALENEANLFRQDPSRLLAPGMSGTKLRDIEAETAALERRRAEINQQINMLDHQIMREADLQSVRDLQAIEAADATAKEQALADARANAGEMARELATADQQARMQLEERLNKIGEWAAAGLEEAEVTRLTSAAHREYDEALQKANGTRKKAVDTEAEFASALFEAVKILDQYQGAVDNAVASMGLENDVLRLQVAGREEQAAWLQEEARLRDQLGALYDQNADQLRTLWEESRRLSESYKAQGEAAKEAQKEIERQLREQERMVDSIVQYGGDRLTDGLFDKTRDGWKDMLSGMLEDLARFLARAAVEAALRPVAIRLVGSMTSGGTAAASAAGGGSGVGLSNLSDIGSILRGGNGTGSLMPGVDSWAQSTFGWGQIGLSSVGAAGVGSVGGGAAASLGVAAVPGGITNAAAAAPGLMGGGSALAGFSSFSNVLGIGGAILPGLISGNYAQAAAGGIGAAIGTAILPGIGTAVGGMLGNLVGGMFGGKEKHPAMGAGINADGSGLFAVTDTSFKHMSAAEAEAMGQPLADAVNGLVQQLMPGATVVGSSYHAIGFDQKSGKYSVNDASGLVAEYDNAEAAMNDLIVRVLRNGQYEGIGEDIATAIANSAATTLDALSADIGFARNFRTMFDEVDPIGPFEQALMDLDARAEAAGERVKALGLDLDAFADGVDAARRRLADDINEQLEREYRGMTGRGYVDVVTDAMEAARLRYQDVVSAGGDGALADRNNMLGLQQMMAQMSAEQLRDIVNTMDGAAAALAEMALKEQAANDNFSRSVAEFSTAADQMQAVVDAAVATFESMAQWSSDLLHSALSPLGGEARMQVAGEQVRSRFDENGFLRIGVTPEQVQSALTNSLTAGRDYYGLSSPEYAAGFRGAMDTAATAAVTAMARATGMQSHAGGVDMLMNSGNFNAYYQEMGLSGGRIPGFASGGDPPLNTPVWVGEQGRELVTFHSPATVHSNSASRAMTQPVDMAPVVGEIRALRGDQARQMSQQNAELAGLRRENRRLSERLSDIEARRPAQTYRRAG